MLEAFSDFLGMSSKHGENREELARRYDQRASGAAQPDARCACVPTVAAEQ
jgi:hypothetical protein